MGATLEGHESGHGGADPEFSGFVGSGGENAASAAPADGDGFAAEGGIVAYFDSRVEAVHIDMDDLALRRVSLCCGLKHVPLGAEVEFSSFGYGSVSTSATFG